MRSFTADDLFPKLERGKLEDTWLSCGTARVGMRSCWKQHLHSILCWMLFFLGAKLGFALVCNVVNCGLGNVKGIYVAAALFL